MDALPANLVLQLLSEDSAIQDLFNDVLFIAVDEEEETVEVVVDRMDSEKEEEKEEIEEEVSAVKEEVKVEAVQEVAVVVAPKEPTRGEPFLARRSSSLTIEPSSVTRQSTRARKAATTLVMNRAGQWIKVSLSNH